MQVRRAIRGGVKWGSTTLVLMDATIWAFSMRYGVEWVSPYRRGRDIVVVYRGSIDVTLGTGSGFSFLTTGEGYEGIGFWSTGELFLEPMAKWKPSWGSHMGVRKMVLPLWVPLVVFIVPAGLAWWSSEAQHRRKWRGGCVRCGYDRRGLAPEAKCPECGTAAKAG